MDGKRFLIVTADDYGIGPETSRAILELAARGRVTATVLLVTSPYAEPAVRAWRQAGCPVEMGWHSCLTLDRPILPPDQVPSLVDAQGRFRPLGRFLARLLAGRIRAEEVAAELEAQYQRFHDLVGHAPTLVNFHHHLHVFPLIGRILRRLLKRQKPLPYVRRVREPWSLLAQVPGIRLKRAVLSLLGRRDARRQDRAGFPGNDWLAGIADPPQVIDPEFFARWLTHVPGETVELVCHPGYRDMTLLGRDCVLGEGQLHRRICELKLMQRITFPDACDEAGFTLVSPSDLSHLHGERRKHAA